MKRWQSRLLSVESVAVIKGMTLTTFSGRVRARNCLQSGFPLQHFRRTISRRSETNFLSPCLLCVINNTVAPVILSCSREYCFAFYENVVTSRMKELSTETTHEDMILAFIQVLDIDTNMAQFFLESSGWDIEAAVSIYLENAGGLPTGPNALVAQQHSVEHQGKKSRTERVPRYIAVDVFIHGLPDGWAAKVSRHSGEIYFIHSATGHRQNAVPPGFADIPLDQQDMSVQGEGEGQKEGGAAANTGTPGNGSGGQTAFAFAPPHPPGLELGGGGGPPIGPGLGGTDGLNVFEVNGPLNQSGDSLGGTGSAGSVASTTGADNNTVGTGGDTDDCNTEAAVYDEGESRALDGTEDDSMM